MPRSKKYVDLGAKPCEGEDCDNEFERRSNQTTTQFRDQKFCSRNCAHISQRRSKRAMCRKKLHALTDDNVRVDPKTGNRRCSACAAAREAARADRAPGVRSPTGKTATPRKKRPPGTAALGPVTQPSVDVPAAPPAPPRPPWRPPGFARQPKTAVAVREAS